MDNRIRAFLLGVGALLCSACNQDLTPGGGGGGGSGGGKIDVPESVGRFVIASGQEKQSKAILPAARVGGSSSLMLSVDPDDISFVPDGGGGTMQLAVAFGEVAGFERACAEPVESFPAFTVTVSASGQVTNISPPNMAVPDHVVDLMTGGQFTICVTYSSSVAGTFDVNALTMN